MRMPAYFFVSLANNLEKNYFLILYRGVFMRYKNESTSEHASVVIVGGGFSGTLLALHFAMMLPRNSPHSVLVLEKTGHFGYGIAYSTQDPYHFLNVRAGRMGAFPDKPGHFFDWLKSCENIWKKEFPFLTITPDCFVPRKLYGMYLQDLLTAAKKLALEKNLNITYMTEEAIDASPAGNEKIHITLSQGKTLTADTLILATNIPTSQRFEIAQDLPKTAYIENIWTPSKDNILAQNSLSHLPESSRIVIIGTGLTMVDATMSLIEKGYPGEILAISKHGELPQSHLDYPETTAFEFKLDDIPKKTLPLVRYVRRQIAAAEKSGIEWQTVIDALRPHVVSIWECMQEEERKRFLRHVISHWNKYRHRIPSTISAILHAHKKIGKLQVKAGHVQGIIKSAKGCKATLIALPHAIEADYIFNCSGAQMDLRYSQNLFLKNLLEKKLILPHSLGKGLQVKDNYQVINEKSATIFAMGLLIFGQKLESVAIPELREQCARIAKEVCFQFLK
jgi:uncharacterized NAD(P)/FAD-binding protein YdhS